MANNPPKSLSSSISRRFFLFATSVGIAAAVLTGCANGTSGTGDHHGSPTQHSLPTTSSPGAGSNEPQIAKPIPPFNGPPCTKPIPPSEINPEHPNAIVEC
jgi:predicted small secreted protein